MLSFSSISTEEQCLLTFSTLVTVFSPGKVDILATEREREREREGEREGERERELYLFTEQGVDCPVRG